MGATKAIRNRRGFELTSAIFWQEKRKQTGVRRLLKGSGKETQQIKREEIFKSWRGERLTGKGGFNEGSEADRKLANL